ncbi:Alpha/Beta hydrolase protein [Russula emetica]|nr:Alpha/Beta hydrolase protein [Russula emetica]
MIDHLVGTPSPSWKRTQVFLVIFFWLWKITWGDARGPRILWIRALNRRLRHFTPWQIIVSTLTAVYTMRNADKLIGLGGKSSGLKVRFRIPVMLKLLLKPYTALEPSSASRKFHPYAPPYYRATWIITGLDAGFATAMNIRQKWLRDICSIVFSLYYIIFANEADEKLRKFRAAPTVEMLRVTWEKTSNPFLRLTLHKKPVALCRKILLPRPESSPHTRPITVHLFYSPHPGHSLSKDPLAALSSERNLIFDVPGGGFVSMGPEHHEERLRSWAYGKAPEYPYPFAVDEVFDAYRIVVESKGKAIGIGIAGEDLNVVLSGDSAGGCLATGCIVKIIEHNLLLSDPTLPYPAPTSRPLAPLPLPVAVMLSYPALDFNFTSWMTPSHLKVLREETEADENRQHSKSPTLLRRQSSSFFYSSDDGGCSEGWAKELRGAKDHLSHANPLAMVNDERKSSSPVRKRKSWRDAFGMGMTSIKGPSTNPPITKRSKSRQSCPQPHARTTQISTDNHGSSDSSSEEDDDDEEEQEEHRPIEARIRWQNSMVSSPDTLSPVHASSLNTLCPRGSGVRENLSTRAQRRLAAEVLRANVEVDKQHKRAAYDRKNAPIGMRLTMTSRSGYFQDRIISPTMMRAMAILYIGPHLNPDFASDYHISPILTPAPLLAKFPPLLLQCGEKDPFVDDTIIFAGRIREAKRQRREEIRKELAMRHGKMDDAEFQRLEDELSHLEVESDEDWLQMQIFSGWSHGYLQMPALMPEAQIAIDDIATWIEGVFSTVSPADSRVPSNSSVQTSASEIEPRSPYLSHILPWAYHKSAAGPATSGNNVHVRLGGDTVSRLRISTPDVNGVASSIYPPEADFEDCVMAIPKVRKEFTMGGREKIWKGVAMPNGTGESGDAILGGKGDEKGTAGGTSRIVRSPPRTPKGFEKSGVVGVGGQIISESELMRRRRLMDSHMFVSEMS